MYSPFQVPRMLRYSKQIDVSSSCVSPAIDHEFRHIIVKLAEWIRKLL